MHYNKRFKQRDIEENLDPKKIKIEPERDPRIRYMKNCMDMDDQILPIFEKIVNKTLCL